MPPPLHPPPFCGVTNPRRCYKSPCGVTDPRLELQIPSWCYKSPSWCYKSPSWCYKSPRGVANLRVVLQGSGDSSAVRAPDSWLKGHGFESLPERREIFFSRVNFLCWLLFRYPFHPRVTAVARKRPRSFCQKCRWQVTAKHAYTLRMWLNMKCHGAWLYGVHRTRRDGSSFLWHQPCQRCKSTTSVDKKKKKKKKKKTHYKKLFTHVESHASAVSLLESGE